MDFLKFVTMLAPHSSQLLMSNPRRVVGYHKDAGDTRCPVEPLFSLIGHLFYGSYRPMSKVPIAVGEQPRTFFDVVVAILSELSEGLDELMPFTNGVDIGGWGFRRNILFDNFC